MNYSFAKVSSELVLLLHIRLWRLRNVKKNLVESCNDYRHSFFARALSTGPCAVRADPPPGRVGCAADSLRLMVDERCT